MKILKVIHGYPLRYNAGSEVYSQTLCHGLAKKHEVHVFTRQEDSFFPDYSIQCESDLDVPSISLYLVNNPRLKDRYRCDEIDNRFAEVLQEVKPDIVHIGHLNHLSTSLIEKAAKLGIPIIYTLHDYWVMCPRGQFMQMFPEDPKDLWPACDGQEDSKCAERCYQRYFSGNLDEMDMDRGYWQDWVRRRMEHMHKMVDLVDLFIAPARYLQERYIRDFGLDSRKVKYLDYGFDHSRFPKRNRVPKEPFTFGYIGTHIPAKGIHHLIKAFSQLKGNSILRIWGRDRGQDSASLRILAGKNNIQWMPEYKNQNIMRDVFNNVDAIVVPSIWVENSPLVIHEAQQARVPVVTADAGGMGEYVKHEVNGLLFPHRSPNGMAKQMQRLMDEPGLAEQLGSRGYLFSDDGNIPSIESQVSTMEEVYQELISRASETRISSSSGPWRITFDTNPDTCNLHCIMCEQHSPEAPKKSSKRIMDFSIIEKTVNEALPLGLKEIIPSTMGEPLLYPYFDNILDLCKETGLSLNLTTNGTWPKRTAFEWGKLILPVASDVKISWNGANAETQESIMQGSKWSQRVEDLLSFLSVRNEINTKATITLQVTFMESNLHELEQLVKWAIEIGFDRVKGHHVWTHTPKLESLSLLRDEDSRRRWNHTVKKITKLANDHPIRLEHFTSVPLKPDHFTSKLSKCPFLGNEAWIDTSGNFAPCCAPNEERKSLGEFRSVKDIELKQIWSGEPYQLLLQSYRTRPLCMSCTMRQSKEVSHELA
jgi:glycosyltransferase involved in cell wall biosynthesis/MoaA/NifB/PqqE/SkfB family radical SAM enzyme